MKHDPTQGTVGEFTMPEARMRGSEFVSQTGRTLLSLREMLLRGDFEPGERISELPLVARLGVSRTPIRLALDRLAHEGLLEISPSGGFVVRAFTLSDIWDAIEMRGVLEGTAARLAAERLTRDSELDTLRRCRDVLDSFLPINTFQPLDALAGFLNRNEAFHSALLDLAKSPMLRRNMELVLSLPFAAPSATVFARSKLPQAAELLTLGNHHHHAIVDAIERREGTRAEAIAREHARLGRRNLEVALADQSILSCVPGAPLVLLPAPAGV